jgi:hypothetical protein
MNKPPQDLGIPILTEVIAAPASEIAPQPVSVEEMAPAPLELSTPARPAVAFEGWVDEEWTRVEQKIRERVLTQILERIDSMIDQRLREGIADVLQTSIARLADDIRAGLRQTLDDVVADAVAQEIERTRFSGN